MNYGIYYEISARYVRQLRTVEASSLTYSFMDRLKYTIVKRQQFRQNVRLKMKIGLNCIAKV